MKRLILGCLPVLLSSAVLAGSFTSGNLVLLQMGDGSAVLTNAATAGFLDEYTIGGSLVQTIGLPTSVSGSNQRITFSGTATSEGFLNRSVDGRYLTMIGYNAAVLSPSITSASVGSTNRVIGLVGANGIVDSTTAISTVMTNGNADASGTFGNSRSVTTVDGTAFWASSSSANFGYVTYGGNTYTRFAGSGYGSGPTGPRVARIYNGQLYGTAASGSLQSIFTVGTGLPTTSGQTQTALPGLSTTAGPSPYDFFMYDSDNNGSLDVAYIADDRTSGIGGIQKWTFNGTTWSSNYTILLYTPSGAVTNGAASLAVDTSGANPVIYAVTRSSANTVTNWLVSVTDTNASDTFTFLAGAPNNTEFRGIAFAPTEAPEPTTILGVGLIALVAGRRMFRRRT